MPAKYESLSYSDTTAEAKSAKRCCGVTLIAKISSFKEERELIRLCYEMNCICDDEFLLLYTGYESQNLELPYHSFSEFDFDISWTVGLNLVNLSFIANNMTAQCRGPYSTAIGPAKSKSVFQVRCDHIYLLLLSLLGH